MNLGSVLKIGGPLYVILVLGMGIPKIDVANACVISKVMYMKDACNRGTMNWATSTANPRTAKMGLTAHEPTVVPAAHTTACLKANYKHARCLFGGAHHQRYQHPADDDGPWWIGASNW
jgi:hypothetical protein